MVDVLSMKRFQRVPCFCFDTWVNSTQQEVSIRGKEAEFIYSSMQVRQGWRSRSASLFSTCCLP